MIVFQGASVAFDLSMEEIWVPYLVGATLKVAPNPVWISIIFRALLREGIRVIDLVPTLLSVLAAGYSEPPADPARRRGAAARDRRALVEAGTSHLQHLRPDRGDGCRDIRRGVARSARHDWRADSRITPAMCVDEASEPVGHGQEGELLIGGPGVAQGYIARPELTAEKFIANPFGAERVTRFSIARVMRSA